MVSLDMARTEPAAGLMVNSTGRPRAACPRHFFRDKSDACLKPLTLGNSNPSPRTCRAKVIGTKDVLKRVHVTVAGKPTQNDTKQTLYYVNEMTVEKKKEQMKQECLL